MERKDTLKRQKECLQVRRLQIENYAKFIAEQQDQQPQPARRLPRKPNKRETTVHFHSDVVLQAAVEEVDAKQVLSLLKAGADCNFKTGNGSSLLHKCCAEGNVAMAELLLLKGADVNVVDDDWWTPLHVACYQDNADNVQLLLTNGADIGMMDVDGNFPIDHTLQHTESWQTIISFMEAKGLTESKMKKLRQKRCQLLEEEVRTILRTAGDLSRAVNSDGVTLLHIACANGYTKCGRLLLKHGAQVNAVTDSGWTPLHVSAKFSQTKMAELLIKHGADTNSTNCDGDTALDVAVDEETQKLLREAGPAKRRSEVMTVRTEDGASREDEEGGSISRTARPFRTALSKADRLMEGQMLIYGRSLVAGETDPAGGNRMDEDGEDKNSGSLSNTHSSQQGELPSPAADDDLSKLPSLTEEIILETILHRYSRKQIYTYIGDVLIAVNPFTELPVYGKWASRIFHSHNQTTSLPPHVYAVAERGLRTMLSSQRSQCCVIGGESGAGKTETCKLIVQHLMTTAASLEHQLGDKIDQASPVLEAFGNAQTTRNPNSSRFAKYLELIFDPRGCVLGGHVHEYVLEKSRVVRQGLREGNFHIFYWLLSGTTPEEKSQLFLEHCNFMYLRNGVSPELMANGQQKLSKIKECMKLIGFSQAEITNVLATLAAILHLGDVIFHESDAKGASIVKDSSVLKKVAVLLQVPYEDLVSALTVDVLIARGEELRKPLSVPQSCVSRDALAKALYSRLFSWTVNGINQLIAAEDDSPTEKLSFGILDIFGFENLERNDFEQMCINLSNEQLHMFYQNQVFQQEKADCLAEGVPPVEVTVPLSQEVVGVFMERNTGLFDLLDEESSFPKATDKTLAAKLHSNLGKKYGKVYKSPKSDGTNFSIVHYAGSVQYQLTGILEKNRDLLHTSLTFVMQSSGNMLVKEVFRSTVTKTGSISPSARQRISRKIKPVHSPFDFFKKLRKSKHGQKTEVAATKTKRSASTLTFHFQNSLKEMLSKLESSAPHFVRCIKPNLSLEPWKAKRKDIATQLHYSGVLQTAVLRKEGYAVRCTFQQFLEKYPALVMLQKPSSSVGDCRQQTIDLLCTFSVPMSQVGRNKVLLHLHQAQELDVHNAGLSSKVILTQAVVRRFLARQLVCRVRMAREEEMQQKLLDTEAQIPQAEKRSEGEVTTADGDEEDMLCISVGDEREEPEMRDPSGNLASIPVEVQKSLEFLDKVLHEFSSPISSLLDAGSSDDESGYQDAASLCSHLASEQGDGDPQSRHSVCEQLVTALEMNRKHSSLHQHQQQSPQQYYSQDAVHDQATCAFPPSPREMYLHQLPGHPGTLNGRQNAGAGGRRAPPAVPERSPDTHLTTQPQSSRKSSISSRSSTSSSEICNEPNEVFDASPQHTHQHHHQFNPAAAGSSRIGESRPFSYAAAIDLRVLQQRQQGGSSNGSNKRLRGVSDGYAANEMSCADNQGSCFQPYSEPESWGMDSVKRASGDSGVGLNGHVHGHPAVYNTGASIVRPSQPLPISGPTLGTQHFSPNHQAPPNSPLQMFQGQQASQPPLPPPSQMYQGQHSYQPPPPPPSQMYQGQRASQPPGGAVLPGAANSTKPFHSHHHIVTKPNPSPPASRKSSSSSSCHSPVSILTEPPAFHGRAAVPPPPSFPAPPPPLHAERCVTEIHEVRSPSPPLPPPPPEMLMSSIGIPSTVSTIPPAQPTVSNQKGHYVVSREQAGGHGNQPDNGMAAQLTQVKLRKTPQAENGVGQAAKDGEEILSPLGIRLKPTQGKFSNIYQKDEVSQEEIFEDLPPTHPPEVDVQSPDPQEKEEDNVGMVHTSMDAESLISAALSKMDLEIPDDIDISQCPGLVEITKATPNWKREMIEKKNRDKIEEYVKQILKEREQAAKWRNVPEWKRALLLKKDQEDQAAPEKPTVAAETMPKSVKKVGSTGPKGDNPPPPVPKPKGEKVPAALNIDPAELESMPPWKRELLFKREKVPASFFNEFNPDEEDEKNVCGQVPLELKEEQGS